MAVIKKRPCAECRELPDVAGPLGLLSRWRARPREKVSGKASKALKQVIWNQAFAFAEPWYVKLVPHPAAVLDD